MRAQFNTVNGEEIAITHINEIKDGLNSISFRSNGWINMELYINNELVFQGENFPNIFTTADSTFALGVNYWDIPFNGFIDEVRIYDNIGLSPLEIEELYNHNLH